MLTIEQIKAAVPSICERHGVERLSLFGSYAHGEADDKVSLTGSARAQDFYQKLQRTRC